MRTNFTNLGFALFCTLLLGFFTASAQAPNIQPHDEYNCVSHGMHAQLLKEHGMEVDYDQFNTWIQSNMARMEASSQSREILTLPLIVHIFHDGEPIGTYPNLSRSRVQNQLTALNQAYRKTPGSFADNNNPNGVDTEIEFCLALFGPDGEALEEPGIDRINLEERGFRTGVQDASYIQSVIQPATIWDPEKYLNVWIFRSISSGGDGNVVGFTSLPGSVDTLSGLPNSIPGIERRDGFVAQANFWGGTSVVNKVTAIHEIGHWLGLLHVEGPFNAGSPNFSCANDDYCDDTNPAATTLSACFNQFSCGSSEPIDNFMVSVVGSCRETFTACQKNRMRTVLMFAPRRRELLTSDVCVVPTVAPIAEVNLTDTIQACDGTFQFMDGTSQDPDKRVLSRLWTVSNGQTSTERNPVFDFDSSGEYTITLQVENGAGSDEITQNVYVEVTAVPIDLGDDIVGCQGDLLNLDATVESPGATYEWFPEVNVNDPSSPTPTITLGNETAYTVVVNFENGCQLTSSINITANPTPSIFALPPGIQTVNYLQEIQLNAIGAESYRWSPGTGLSDSTIANPIATPNDTITYVVTGSNSFGCSKQDSIVIHVRNPGPPLGLSNSFEQIGQVMPVYPNPATNKVFFSADFKSQGDLKLRLLDLHGQAVSTLHSGRVASGSWKLDWEKTGNISSGIYLVEWQKGGARFIQKLTIF